MEYVLTGLVVAAAFAVIAYQQPVVYETLFPWLATSSALLIFALLFTQLSAYVDPTKLPDMFLIIIVGLGTVSYLYFLRLLTATVKSTFSEPSSPRRSSATIERHALIDVDSLHYGIGTAIACRSSSGSSFGNGRASRANGRTMITPRVASSLGVYSSHNMIQYRRRKAEAVQGKKLKKNRKNGYPTSPHALTNGGLPYWDA